VADDEKVKAALDKMFEAMDELEKLHYRPPEDEARDSSCTFCAKLRSEVKHMIAGPKVFICEECVERCAKLLAELGANDQAI